VGAVDWAELAIRLSVAVVMVSFGVHQMKRPDEWQHYFPAWLRRTLPIPENISMMVHGLANIILGLLFAGSIWGSVSTWIVLFWWLSILPFAFYAKWDIGMRDFAVICAIVSLLLLQTEKS
jgi:hypothetical protein